MTVILYVLFCIDIYCDIEIMLVYLFRQQERIFISMILENKKRKY